MERREKTNSPRRDPPLGIHHPLPRHIPMVEPRLPVPLPLRMRPIPVHQIREMLQTHTDLAGALGWTCPETCVVS